MFYIKNLSKLPAASPSRPSCLPRPPRVVRPPLLAIMLFAREAYCKLSNYIKYNNKKIFTINFYYKLTNNYQEKSCKRVIIIGVKI